MQCWKRGKSDLRPQAGEDCAEGRLLGESKATTAILQFLADMTAGVENLPVCGWRVSIPILPSTWNETVGG
jgi:hypothetical protein